ncbi:MAG: DNA repair protein RecO [Chloroflexi bacterium]|nr:DNA repair protein RecO [Chloroflexota bacterium]
MGVSQVYKTEAVVLKATDLGEADRILTLYTPNYGKIRAVAKGSRRPKSKLGGHVEPLTHSAMMLARGRNLDIVTQSQTLDSFMALRDDLWRMTCGIYAAEMVERFTPDHAENYSLFRLLVDTLHRLSEPSTGELVLRFFEVKLLDFLGYRPELRQCVSCRESLQPVANFFSASGGGVICPSCRDREPVCRPLCLAALKVLRYLQDEEYAAVSRVRLQPDLAAELEYLLREYIRYLLEREVKSVAFMDSLRKTEWPQREKVA